MSKNNGGETDYYNISKYETVQDMIEDRELNFSQGNICKVACTINVGRHKGTTYERDLNKLIYFAHRELARIKK